MDYPFELATLLQVGFMPIVPSDGENLGWGVRGVSLERSSDLSRFSTYGFL